MVNRVRLWSGVLVVLSISLLVVFGREVVVTLDLPPYRPPRSIPNTDVNPFGANFFLEREVELWKREETVHMASEAGLGWARQQFLWAEIEPEPGQYYWEKYDEIVDLYSRYGLRIVARLDHPPAWVRADGRVPGPPDDLETYGEFVSQFVRHYRGRINYIQIWNEPNLSTEWGGEPVDPERYTELLRVAYTRAKEVDPNVYVLSAPLATTVGEPGDQPGTWRAMNEVQFLREMYAAGAGAYFDILSANAFGMEYPPEDPPDPERLNFARVVLQRQVMEEYGDEGKPIWFSEYGWNAAPATFPKEKLIWQRVDEIDQARYVLEGIEYAREHWPWAGVFAIWYFRQVGNIPPDDAAYYFRMVDVGFTPRRVYYAVQDAAASLTEAGPGYYEELAPAIEAGSGWQLRVDPGASGGQELVSQEPGASLSFAFQGTRVRLLTRVGPDRGRLIVTLDGHNVEGLPVDAEKHTYVELYAPEERWVWLELVDGVAPTSHVLRLTVSDAPHLQSQGLWCEVDALEVQVNRWGAVPWGTVAGLSIGIVLSTLMVRREVKRSRVC